MRSSQLSFLFNPNVLLGDAKMKDRALLFFFYAIFIMISWYHFKAGKNQPVDLLIIFLFFFLLLHHKFRRLLRIFLSTISLTRNLSMWSSLKIKKIDSNGVFLSLGVFFLFCILRFAIGFLLSGDGYLLHNCANFLYSQVLVFCFLSLFVYLYCTHSTENFYHIILNCLVLSTLPPLIDSFLPVKFQNHRLALTFNNANQVGFFVFIMLSLLYYATITACAHGFKIKKMVSLYVLNCQLYFLFLSATRAAVPAVLIYLATYSLLFQQISKKAKAFLYVFVGLFVLALLIRHAMWQIVQFNIKHVQIAGFDSVGSDIYSRAIEGIGYNLSNIGLFLFGNGSETNVLRSRGLEFHSNFFCVFNQLGLIGLCFYVVVLFKIFIALYKKGAQYLLPFWIFLFFSFFQYTLRNRLNWLFFSVLLFFSIQDRLINFWSIKMKGNR